MPSQNFETKHDSFSTYLRAMRKAMDKTQTWVSLHVVSQSITSGYISMYERGVLYPALDVQSDIRKAFHDELLRVEEIIGKWKSDYVMLRYYVEVVNICKGNIEEEKKAYTNLKNYVANNSDMAEWKLEIFDPAFGKMELFKEDET